MKEVENAPVAEEAPARLGLPVAAMRVQQVLELVKIYARVELHPESLVLYRVLRPIWNDMWAIL